MARLRLGFALLAAALSLPAISALGSPADALFTEGVRAYRAADFVRAAWAFRESVQRQPAAGSLEDLGIAEWQLGQTGPAVLAWEQALWLDPFNKEARHNLRVGRKLAQLESPELTWAEVVSSWLPSSWWAWITGGSLWLALGMGMLPGILRLRKAGWHQAAAAIGLMIFLLSLPAQLGVQTRARIGFVLQRDTPLRLTPTLGAQSNTRLGAGDPIRIERVRGRYVLVRASHVRGWLDRDQLGLICPDNSSSLPVW